jgi:transposase
MMGQQTGLQERLFYEFRLEDWVPVDHLLRKIDGVLDLSSLRRELAPVYSHTGRPSVDPELMVRMLLVGYCYGLRSERRLCDETHLNLAYRWFCRLGLEGTVPDHSTFPKIGTAAFARALCSAACLKRLWRAACGQDWLAAKALPSTPV